MPVKNSAYFFAFISCTIAHYSNTTVNDMTYFDEVRGLSELPLDKLIRIKSSFINEFDGSGRYPGDPRTSLPMQVNLPRKRYGGQPMRRGDPWEEKEKDSKISKIFQLAVTALSFLAFGGYLLTLIIVAVKRNKTFSGGTTGNVIVLSNLKGLQKYKRPKRGFDIYDPMENLYDTDQMYQGMIMLSRGYALYTSNAPY